MRLSHPFPRLSTCEENIVINDPYLRPLNHENLTVYDYNDRMNFAVN